MNRLLGLFFIVFLSGCSFFSKKVETDSDVIARVNEELLYASDLQQLTKGLGSSDSLQVLRNYAETWVRKILLLQKAKDNISEDDVSIARNVEDYKEVLLLHEYEKELIQQKLDTAVSAQQLQDLYEKMKQDFLLPEDVYQIYYINFDNDSLVNKQVRAWITKPESEEDEVQLEAYCKEFATSYTLATSLWFSEENMMKKFPLSKFELQQLKSSGKFMEFKRVSQALFLKVVDSKQKDEPAPADFVREQIVKAIIEKRKLDLIERVYNKVYQDGIKAKTVEVFLK